MENSKKKVAIIYFGLLRSYDKVYKSHINNIFNVLKKNNIDFKIFVHTWKTKDNTQRVWEKTIAVKQNFDQIKLMNAYKAKIDEQEDFEKNLKFSDYFYQNVWDSIGHDVKGEWLPGLVKNHLCALESQKRCFAMVQNDNTKFDYVMFLRPDVLIKNIFPIDSLQFLNKNNEGILIPNFAHHEGINDRFALMNFNHGKFYANRINELADYRKKHGRIVSEKCTAYIVNKYYIKKLIQFRFDIIRP